MKAPSLSHKALLLSSFLLPLVFSLCFSAIFLHFRPPSLWKDTFFSPSVAVSLFSSSLPHTAGKSHLHLLSPSSPPPIPLSLALWRLLPKATKDLKNKPKDRSLPHLISLLHAIHLPALSFLEPSPPWPAKRDSPDNCPDSFSGSLSSFYKPQVTFHKALSSMIFIIHISISQNGALRPASQSPGVDVKNSGARIHADLLNQTLEV